MQSDEFFTTLGASIMAAMSTTAAAGGTAAAAGGAAAAGTAAAAGGTAAATAVGVGATALTAASLASAGLSIANAVGGGPDVSDMSAMFKKDQAGVAQAGLMARARKVRGIQGTMLSRMVPSQLSAPVAQASGLKSTFGG